MNETLLTWNVRNWITVVLMVALAWLLVTGAMSGFAKFRGNKKQATKNA